MKKRDRGKRENMKCLLIFITISSFTVSQDDSISPAQFRIQEEKLKFVKGIVSESANLLRPTIVFFADVISVTYLASIIVFQLLLQKSDNPKISLLSDKTVSLIKNINASRDGDDASNISGKDGKSSGNQESENKNEAKNSIVLNIDYDGNEKITYEVKNERNYKNYLKHTLKLNQRIDSSPNVLQSSYSDKDSKRLPRQTQDKEDMLYSQAQVVSSSGEALVEVGRIKASLPSRRTTNAPSDVEFNHFIDMIMNSANVPEINRINREFSQYRAKEDSYNSALRNEIQELDNQIKTAPANSGTGQNLRKLKKLLENALNDTIELKKATLNAYKQRTLNSAFQTLLQDRDYKGTQKPSNQVTSSTPQHSYEELVQQLLHLLNKDKNVKKDPVVVVQTLTNGQTSGNPTAFTAKHLVDTLIHDNVALQKLQNLIIPEEDDYDDWFYDFFFR